jgi:hypothetical protein
MTTLSFSLTHLSCTLLFDREQQRKHQKNTPTAPSLGAEQELEKRWQIKVKVINLSSLSLFVCVVQAWAS